MCQEKQSAEEAQETDECQHMGVAPHVLQGMQSGDFERQIFPLYAALQDCLHSKDSDAISKARSEHSERGRNGFNGSSRYQHLPTCVPST